MFKTKMMITMLMVALTTGLFAQSYSGGSGTVDDPYQIANTTDLGYLAINPDEWSKHFIQTADIAFADADFESGGEYYNNGWGWTAIAYWSPFFTGVYDGDNHIIDNVYVNNGSANFSHGGLFHTVGVGGNIKNLGLENVYVHAYNFSGGLAAVNNGGILENCYVSGEIVGKEEKQGGLFGHHTNSGQIINCYTTGTVTGDYYSTGGMVGLIDGGASIENSYSTCNVSSTGGGYTGGFIGQCPSGGAMNVDNCYCTGDVSASSSNYYTGGFIGYARGGNIDNCYSKSSVNGYNYTGGFIGYNNSYTYVNNSYSTGLVNGNSGDVGGFSSGNNGTINDCFWDTETSGQEANVGGTGLTTAEMQTQSTFTDAGWDFIDIWLIDGSNNDGYAYLQWQPYEPTNTAPIADDISVTTDEDTAVDIVLAGSDIDGDALTFAVVDMPTNGIYTDGVYTPNADWFGVDTFTYIANDGTIDSEIATVTITVNAVADYGCIDETACNFDTEADTDDGSCLSADITCWDGEVVCDEVDCLETPEFTPVITFELDNLYEDVITDLTFTIGQDAGETDILSSLVVSDGGSFDIASMNIGDVLGFSTMSFAGGAVNLELGLTVYQLDGDDINVVSTITASDTPGYEVGMPVGGFVLSNTDIGISIYTENPGDSNTTTSGNSTFVTLDGIFVNPNNGALTFTSTLTSDLEDVDVQEFVFDILSIPPVHNVTQDTYYETIQAAIDASIAADVIEISEGVYAEALLVQTDGITIRGIDRDNVIIDATGSAYGSHILANDITLQTMTIKYAANYNIHATGNISGLTISDLTAIGQGQYIGNSGGIDLNNVDNVLIENVFSKEHSKNGIQMLASNNVTLKDITSKDNGIGSGWANIAVYTYSENFPELSGNTENLIFEGLISLDRGFTGLYFEDYPGFNISASLADGAFIDYIDPPTPLAILGLGEVFEIDNFAISTELTARLNYAFLEIPTVATYYGDVNDASAMAMYFTQSGAEVVTDLLTGETFTWDCLGDWEGGAVEDMCLICDNDPSNDCVEDCAGNWGGDAIEDMCGICDNNPSNDCVQDCAGDWGGDAVGDIFNICNGDNTIQGAINAVDEGSTINIPSGTYFEQLNITKSLTLSGSEGTIIDVSGFSHGIIINANDVAVSGLEVIGDESTVAGIDIMPGSSNITISDNVIHGMKLPNSSGSSPASYGILAWGDDDPYIPTPPNNIVLSGNEIYDVNMMGISLGTYTAYVTISNNNIHDLIPADLSEFGIEDSLSIAVQGVASNGVSVLDNTISNVILGVNLWMSIGSVSGNSFNEVLVYVSHDKNNPLSVSDLPQNAFAEFTQYQDETAYVANSYFAFIQDAIDVADEGTEIVVSAGTFVEQLELTKSLTLNGMNNPVIQAPENMTTYQIVQWNGSQKDIMAVVGVHDAENVNISGFTIDGNYEGSGYYQGIHYFNTSGNISFNTITNILNPSSPGAQGVASIVSTHGVDQEYSINISANSIPGFQKGAIVSIGPGCTFSIDNNIITNALSEYIAGNGIQVGYGASGSISGNDVQGVAYEGEDWGATGILLFESGDVSLNGNVVDNCEMGISYTAWNWIYTHPEPVNIVLNNIELHSNDWAFVAHLAGDNDDLNLIVSESNIHDNNYDGFDVYGTGQDPWGGGYYSGWNNGNLNLTLTESIISNSGQDGIWTADYSGNSNNTEIDVHYVSITGNGNAGINNGFLQTIAASYCYWGSETGPSFSNRSFSNTSISHSAKPFDVELPNGVNKLQKTNIINSQNRNGDAILGSVDFIPWFTDAEMTNLWYPPEIEIYPTEIVETVDYNEVSIREFTISNSGPANTELIYDIDWNYTTFLDREPESENWLAVTPISGECNSGETDVIEVELNSTGLIDGFYSAEIIVSSNDILNTTQTINVSLTVESSLITFNTIFSTGWNWFSINIESADMSLDIVLSSLGDSGETIKNQTGFATYYEDFGWYGLDAIDVTSMYMINMSSSAELSFTGIAVDFVNIAIALAGGWNWIGYLPQTSNTLENALASIGENALLIKSQTEFATYYEGFGWYGMDALNPGDGYMISMNANAELVYGIPDGLIRTDDKVVDFHWDIDYRSFEHNMTITANVEIDGIQISEDDQLAVFVNDECRGTAIPTYFPLTDSYTINLMTYGDNGEELSFKVYQSDTGKEIELLDNITFEVNGNTGNDIDPILLRAELIPEAFGLSQNYPNPFNPTTTIGYSIPAPSSLLLAIYNINGQLVETLVNTQMEAGYHSVVWNADNFASGVYIVKLTVGSYTKTQKVLLMK